MIKIGRILVRFFTFTNCLQKACKPFTYYYSFANKRIVYYLYNQ